MPPFRRNGDRGYFERFLAEWDRRLDERFEAQEKAIDLKLAQSRIEVAKNETEIQRRLTDLNHAHQQARDKERDFIPRETYEKQIERLNTDIRSISETVKTAAQPVAKALSEQSERNNERFNKLENLQSRLLGGLLLASLLIPLVMSAVYFLLR